MTAPAIRPIETRYKGYRFRSRLEARWAVVFDRLEIPWGYEVQGYALPSGPYLPDFELRPRNFPLLQVEVKGNLSGFKEWWKITELVRNGCHVTLLADIPEPANRHQEGNPLFQAYGPCEEGDLCRNGGECAWGGLHVGWLGFWPHGQVQVGDIGDRPLFSAGVEGAFTAGRQARFEHGEQPS
jgi:hypothetical protein